MKTIDTPAGRFQVAGPAFSDPTPTTRGEIMFPGAGASVYYNDEGEPLGWDHPGDEPYDPDDYLAGDYDDEEPEDDDEPAQGSEPTRDSVRAWLGDTHDELTPEQRNDVLIAARDLAHQYPHPDQAAEFERELSAFVRGLLSGGEAGS